MMGQILKLLVYTYIVLGQNTQIWPNNNSTSISVGWVSFYLLLGMNVIFSLNLLEKLIDTNRSIFCGLI